MLAELPRKIHNGTTREIDPKLKLSNYPDPTTKVAIIKKVVYGLLHTTTQRTAAC